MMKTILTLFAAVASLTLMGATVEDPGALDPRAISIRTIEPDRDVGYTVGDILSRTAIIEVKKPYELLPTSLPIAGNDKKRQNRGSGIEVREVTVEKSSGIDTNTYSIHLSYQVFTNKIVARPAALPAELIKFGGKGENFQVRVPSWNFRISPLAVYGSVIVEKDMSTFRGPLLLDSTRNQLILKALLAVLTVSLLGLLYVLGSRSWLPRMGRPFARALRDIRKLPDNTEGIAQAVSLLHQAMNTTVGAGVFEASSFLLHQPAFAPIETDVERFFQLSRHVFFEPAAAHGIDGSVMAWLRQFCRRCRDCERGMK
jgi:mxaA protein